MMAPQEGQREQRTSGEGVGVVDKGIQKVYGRVGSTALFYPWVTGVSQVWAEVASLIIWQQIETVQP